VEVSGSWLDPVVPEVAGWTEVDERWVDELVELVDEVASDAADGVTLVMAWTAMPVPIPRNAATLRAPAAILDRAAAWRRLGRRPGVGPGRFREGAVIGGSSFAHRTAPRCRPGLRRSPELAGDRL
jgi:hypothetical protein